MTKKWWMTGQHLLVMVASLLVFSTVAAGGQLATWESGQAWDSESGSVTLTTGQYVIFAFSPRVVDGTKLLRICMTLENVTGASADSTLIGLATADTLAGVTSWDGFQSGVRDDQYGNFIASGGPSFVFDGSKFDFPIGYAVSQQGAVKFVRIQNNNSNAITVTGVEASPFDPAEMVEALVIAVQGVNEANGIANNSLEAKLQAAVNALNDANNHNNAAAINSLEAFQSYCEMQYGKGLISEPDKVNLVAQAQDIIDTLMAMAQ